MYSSLWLRICCEIGLLHLLRRRLALDHRQGDAVDEQDDVGPRGLVAPRALDGELGRHVEDIVLGMLPVDVAKVEALGVALDGLLQRRAQREQVVDVLVGALQPVVAHALELLDGGLDVLLAEEVLAALVGDAVDALELLAENLVQQDIAGLPQASGERFRAAGTRSPD